MSTPTPLTPRRPTTPPSLPGAEDTGAQNTDPRSSALERLKASAPPQVPPTGSTQVSKPATAKTMTEAEDAAVGQSTPAPADPAHQSGDADDTGDRPAPAALKATVSAAAAWSGQAGSRTARWSAQTGSRAVSNVRSWRPDQIRRNIVTLTLIGASVGSAAASGVFGGPDIRNSPALDPSTSLVAPAAQSIYLWVLIYAGIVGYTVHQWLPSQQRSLRHRGLGWIVVAALLLHLGAIVAVRESRPLVALVLLVVLLAVLSLSLRRLNRYPAATRLEGALVDVPLGLFLGWTGVTVLSQSAVVLTMRGIDWLGLGAVTWALIGIAVLTLAVCVVCSTDRGRMAVALATVWGLLGILAVRLFGDPVSIPVVFATGLGAFFLLITAGSRRHRVDHSNRRALRAEQAVAFPPINLDMGDDYDDDTR